MIATWGASSGINQFLTFSLPLGDLGAGAVDTTPVGAAGDGMPTFTRATVAWTKLSTGLWASVASGTARSCYLGATTAVGDYGGYLAEGAGTQLVTPTASIRDMTDAAWVAGATMTVAKDGTGIDGAANSCSRLTGGAVAATNTIFQTLVAAATSRTYSVWLKRVTGTGVINITQDGGVGYTDVTSQINASTFTRVSLTASQLNAVFGIQVVTDTDVILADFNQFEARAFATSPMASAGAARNADVLSYVNTGNFSDANGSVYAEVNFTTASADIANTRIVSVSANGNPLMVNNPTLNTFQIQDSTSNIADTIVAVAGTQYKIASSWATGGALALYSQGVAATPGSYDGTFSPSAIGIGQRIGTGLAQPFACHRNIRIYSRALTDAQLQAMTT